MSRSSTVWGALALLVVMVAAAPAWASGLSSPLVGTGLSSPVRADPAAVFWNPALLADGDGRFGVLASLGGGWLGVRYARERRGVYQREDGLSLGAPLAEEDLDRSKTGAAAEVASDRALPLGSLFLAVKPTDNTALGLGVYAPAGALLTFPEAGPQRWALQDLNLVTVAVHPALSLRLPLGLRLGAGVALVAGSLGLRRVVDLAGTDMMGEAFSSPPIAQDNDLGADAPPYVRELDALSRPFTVPDARGLSWTWNVGLAWDPVPALTVGASYVHRVDMVYTGQFHLDMDDPLWTHDLASQGVAYPREVTGEATLRLPLPGALRGGLAVRAIPGLVLALSGEYQLASTVDRLRAKASSPALAQPAMGLGEEAALDLPRHWRDAWSVELSALTAALGDVEAWASLGYHTPVSPDAHMDLAGLDGERLALGTGARLPLTDVLALVADVKLHWLLEREVVASAQDVGNGTYRLWAVLGAVGLEVR